MRCGSDFWNRSLVFTLLFASFSFPAVLLAQKATHPRKADVVQPGELTIDRIYGHANAGSPLTGAIVWAPDGKRLAFLETRNSRNENSTELWALDTSSGERTLLISAEKLESILAPATEDAAVSRHPVPEFMWAPSGDALLFKQRTSLLWFDLKKQSARVLASGKQILADAKISPDGKYVSFLRDHNIWLVGVAEGKQRPFTTDGSEEIRKGELDWVYPEELEIYSAYWWAPDSSRIAFLEMDERRVSQFPLVDFKSFTGEPELQRYPVAGGSNPVVRVLVGAISGGEPRVIDTGANTDIYIPRVDWLPDSRRLAIQRLSRSQTELDLLVADAIRGTSSTLLTEQDQYWINVSDDLRFFKDGRFLWSSERSGYRHLYLYDSSGKQLAQLTKGDWEVTHLDALREANGWIYFTATQKSPLERHLYRVSLSGDTLTRLTKEDGTHSVQMSPGNDFYVDTYSNVSTEPRQILYHADGERVATIGGNENSAQELSRFHLSPVEFFSVRSHDGVLLNAFLIKPPGFDPAHKYPVLVYTYGGPHAQVVVNAWRGETFLWHQMMAQKGYVILALDNRGSAGRGHLFEEPIHFRFGAQELSDQRDGIVWLQKQPWVDTKRIGICGWSYGGHMVLHAMFEAANVFKAGFAGGPVTDWHYYDSIYTERYLGLPQRNIANYKESSPVDNAERLKGKLLIAHATGDDNVHYSNTLALVDDMIRDGKYVEVIAVPCRGHTIDDSTARRMVWQRVTQFFLDNL